MRLLFSQTTNPNITKGIKECVNRKKRAFKTRNREALNCAQSKRKRLPRAARKRQKNFLEETFNKLNPKRMWNSIKSISNMTPAKKHLTTAGDLQIANELSNSYSRFETLRVRRSCNQLYPF